MRSRLAVLAALFLCVPLSNAWAGRIFGDIKQDGKPLPSGVLVMIRHAGNEKKADEKKADDKKAAPAKVDSTKTDKFGSYKLSVKEEGKCILEVLYENQKASLEVFSYKEATRYDLILEKKEGKLNLRRK